MKTRKLGTIFVALLIAVAFAPAVAFADGKSFSFHKRHINFSFDVAEIGARFVPDDDPFVGGLPAYGNSFITQGYIYPAGTLTDSNGVNIDGSAQFPEKVIGRWTCFGWHTQDAATAVEGEAVVTTQIYSFNDTPGKVTFVSDGFELPFFVFDSIKRAVTGGTGPLSSVRGEVKQRFLGFPNEGGGVNLRFKAKLRNY